MRARDLAQPYPVVRTTDPATDAARLLAREDVDVLLVQDVDGRVIGPLHDLDMLAALVPPYCVEDRALARVLGEGGADELWERLVGKDVGDLLRTHGAGQAAVDGDAGLLEIAAEMLGARSTLVAVVDGTSVLGGITSSQVLTALLVP